MNLVSIGVSLNVFQQTFAGRPREVDYDSIRWPVPHNVVGRPQIANQRLLSRQRGIYLKASRFHQTGVFEHLTPFQREFFHRHFSHSRT